MVMPLDLYYNFVKSVLNYISTCCVHYFMLFFNTLTWKFSIFLSILTSPHLQALVVVIPQLRFFPALCLTCSLMSHWGWRGLNPSLCLTCSLMSHWGWRGLNPSLCLTCSLMSHWGWRGLNPSLCLTWIWSLDVLHQSEIPCKMTRKAERQGS